eukprot:TRINITY_DN10185_c0_g1_i1.p2 TRINITY_DN10185_c0_g1~~TRINITY_DN10185_c0_g1_i1.p2  ORF type:complete len:130 (+),score=21.86 TRINITY_DN10185_c0_g1_i1:16-405(+)
MKARSIQEYFESNIDLFTTSAAQRNCVLLLHAMNQAAGLKCDGLLENDPPNDNYNSKLPDFWANSEVISLRYKNSNGKHVYFKYVIVNEGIEVNAVTEEQNDTILSVSIRYFPSIRIVQRIMQEWTGTT